MNVPPGGRVAIVGSGVAGLVAAHLLREQYEVTVFEADDRIGGHVHTVEVRDARDAAHAVDTGFIVFNEHNYPRFCALLAELGVGSRASTMSFSARAQGSGWEYSGAGARGLFVRPSSVASVAHWRMVRGILRFFREAPRLLEPGADPTESLGEYLARQRYPSPFVERFILPMGAAIWSASDAQILAFPAAHFVRFFDHHRMLQLRNRPEWRVIEGGSRTYVEALVRPFRDRFFTSSPVRKVLRHGSGVDVWTDAAHDTFDGVVLAVHSDQALRLLGDPSPAETEILGAVAYQANEVVLHTDVGLLPRSRAAWSAWNVERAAPGRDGRDRPVAVSYHMNTLQRLDAASEFVVTLNQSAAIDPQRVLRHFDYAHPVLDRAAVAAQARHAEISGRDRTFYCGAWWGFGFHEDGVQSGEAVARQLGARSLGGARSLAEGGAA